MTTQLFGSMGGNVMSVPKMRDFLVNSPTDSMKKGQQE